MRLEVTEFQHELRLMDVWIISEHEDLTHRIRRAIERIDGGTSYVRASNVSACLNSGVLNAAADDVVFFATHQLSGDDLEMLRQLRSGLQATLAVVASMTDNAVVLRAIRAGAEDFLDANGALNDEIGQFLAKVRASNSNRSTSGRLIAVLSCHLPLDASILSTNVAAVVAREVGECALLDFHRRGGDLALLLKIAPRHTLADLKSQSRGIDQAMFQQALGRHDCGIRLLASPHGWSQQEQAFSQGSYQEIVDLARSTHPAVIVSSEDLPHLAQLMTLPQCDQIVLAMRLDLVSLHRAQRHIEFLSQCDVPLQRVEVVAMGTGLSSELPVAAVIKTLNVPRIHLVPNDAVACTVSINLGNPLVIEAPHSAASTAIKRLAQVVMEASYTRFGAANGGRLATAKAAALGAVSVLLGR